MSDRIPEGFAELSFQYINENDPEVMITSIGIQFATDFLAALIDTTAVVNEWSSQMSDHMGVEYTINGAVVTVGQATDGDLDFPTGDVQESTSTSSALPQNVTLLVRKNTFLGGRRNRGRMYLPGVPNNYSDSSGAVASTPFTNIANSLQAFTDFVAGTDEILSLVLFHQTAPFDPTTINGLQIDTRVATQRRRLRP